MISKNLSWKNHIDLITSKATTTRIFCQRNLPMTDKETRLKCYKTFIRPIVEYASSVWDPVENQSLTHQIEMIKRKSIRWICNDWRTEISPDKLRKSLERQLNCSIETLQTRRTKSKLKMLFDIMSGNKFVDPIAHPSRQRCKNVKYQPMQGRIKC